MKVDEARKILLVRAVETTDSEGVLLSESMCRKAERQARDAVNPRDSPEDFLAARAERLYELISDASPALKLAGRPFGFKKLLIGSLCVIALLVGLGLNELGAGPTINILSAPILALIVWNLFVFLISVIGLVVSWRSLGKHTSGAWLNDLLHWLVDHVPMRQRRSGRQTRLEFNAVREFVTQWFKHGRSLHVAQARLILHGGACLLIVGAIAGMYWRGFASEYRATWESTFFEASGVRSVLVVALGPASALLGEPIPDVETLKAMKTTPLPAAMWIHRYALTTVLLVIVPRLLLAGIEFVRLRRLRKTFPLDVQSDMYFRALLAPDRGEGIVVRIQAYSFQPADKSLETLKRNLRLHFGYRVDVEVAETLEYGDECELIGDGINEPSPYFILLFNASQTPEREVHGSLISRFASAASGHERLIVLIDETALRERLGDDPLDEDRLDQRRSAWRQVVEGQNVQPQFVVLETFDARQLAEVR